MTNVSALTAISSDFYEEGEEGFESSESGQIEQASSSSSPAAPQSQRTDLMPTAVADHVTSSVARLAKEAADAASATLAQEAREVIPLLVEHHQGRLGQLAAAICVALGAPAGGRAFARSFQDGLEAASLASHSFSQPDAVDFLDIAQAAIDEA